MSTGDWIQAVIAVASVLALGGLIFSIRSLRGATFASVYQGIAGQMHDLDKLFIETPELRPYFYGKRKLPEDEDKREQLLATAELIVDFADNCLAQRPVLRTEYERGWEDYFRDLYRLSPAIQHFWSKCSGWYSEDLRELFTEDALEDSTAASGPASESVAANVAPT